MDRLQPQADRRVGRDDRLEHGASRPFPNGRHNFPKFTRQSANANRAEPLHDDAAERAGVARAVHLRGSRHAVEHRRAQSRRHGLPAADRDQIICGRAVHSPTARSRSRPTSRSAPTCSRGSRSTAAIVHFDPDRPDQRRAQIGGDRRRRPGALARADLSDQSNIDFPTQKNIFFHSQTVHGVGQRGLRRHVPPVQGRPRAEGHISPARSPASTLAVPEPARLGALGAGPAGDHERHARSLRRHGALRLPDGAASARRTCRHARPGRGLSRTSTSRAHRLSRDVRACGWRAARRAATISSGRSASGREKRGRGEVTSQPPPGVRPMTRELPAGRDRAKVADLPARGGSVQSARCRSATCRSPRASSTRSTRSGSRSADSWAATERPTSSSRGARRTASGRRSRSTSRASTGRRATACWPAS